MKNEHKLALLLAVGFCMCLANHFHLMNRLADNNKQVFPSGRVTSDFLMDSPSKTCGRLGWRERDSQPAPRIFDCFNFHHELDQLEVRLRELYDHVDFFVLVESSFTYTNQDKPLYYNENRQRFSRWADKIIHVVLDHYAPAESRIINTLDLTEYYRENGDNVVGVRPPTFVKKSLHDPAMVRALSRSKSTYNLHKYSTRCTVCVRVMCVRVVCVRVVCVCVVYSV